MTLKSKNGEQGSGASIRKVNTDEPRWPALLALLALGGLYAALPSNIHLGGPKWLLLAVILLLAIPSIISHHRGRHSLNQALGYLLNSVVTAALIASLALLIRELPAHLMTSEQLLRSAAGLWLVNILVFASWYWRLDAGGPSKRAQKGAHTEGAFLFPQMMMAQPMRWAPRFIDYLFLAFNTSTAFSPTDVPVLSRWAKLLMMAQSLISLLIVVLLGARAVNIL